jgi:hypothetical protein
MGCLTGSSKNVPPTLPRIYTVSSNLIETSSILIQHVKSIESKLEQISSKTQISPNSKCEQILQPLSLPPKTKTHKTSYFAFKFISTHRSIDDFSSSSRFSLYVYDLNSNFYSIYFELVFNKTIPSGCYQ